MNRRVLFLVIGCLFLQISTGCLVIVDSPVEITFAGRVTDAGANALHGQNVKFCVTANYSDNEEPEVDCDLVNTDIDGRFWSTLTFHPVFRTKGPAMPTHELIQNLNATLELGTAVFVGRLAPSVNEIAYDYNEGADVYRANVEVTFVASLQ